MPSKDAQPQVTLLPGGRMLSIQWKLDKRLFSHLQASIQGVETNSSRYIGYSDTMIQLNVECTGIQG